MLILTVLNFYSEKEFYYFDVILDERNRKPDRIN